MEGSFEHRARRELPVPHRGTFDTELHPADRWTGRSGTRRSSLAPRPHPVSTRRLPRYPDTGCLSVWDADGARALPPGPRSGRPVRGGEGRGRVPFCLGARARWAGPSRGDAVRGFGGGESRPRFRKVHGRRARHMPTLPGRRSPLPPCDLRGHRAGLQRPATVEAWRSGKWGAVDCGRSVFYRTEGGASASTWYLMSRPELLEAQPVGSPGGVARRGQFLWSTTANHALGPFESAD